MPHRVRRRTPWGLGCVGGLAATLLAAVVARGGPATRPATAPTASIEVQGVDGVPRRPLEADGTSAATVVLFITTDCPIANSYAPEVVRICQAYAPRGVRFFLAHADQDRTAAEAKVHAKEFGLADAPACTVVLDGTRALARRLGARVTPEAAVIDAGGRVVYCGRIDDKWVDYGKSRAQPTTRDLRDALDAVLAGKPVPASGVRAVGCPIELEP